MRKISPIHYYFFSLSVWCLHCFYFSNFEAKLMVEWKLQLPWLGWWCLIFSNHSRSIAKGPLLELWLGWWGLGFSNPEAQFDIFSNHETRLTPFPNSEVRSAAFSNSEPRSVAESFLSEHAYSLLVCSCDTPLFLLIIIIAETHESTEKERKRLLPTCLKKKESMRYNEL